MLWGTSSLALYIPWAGAAGPYLGTSLWLWLGVLDAIQGVGLGMILLQVSLVRVGVTEFANVVFIDVIASSRLCDSRVCPDYWIGLRYGCARHGTQSCRAW